MCWLELSSQCTNNSGTFFLPSPPRLIARRVNPSLNAITERSGHSFLYKTQKTPMGMAGAWSRASPFDSLLHSPFCSSPNGMSQRSFILYGIRFLPSNRSVSLSRSKTCTSSLVYSAKLFTEGNARAELEGKLILPMSCDAVLSPLLPSTSLHS